MDIKKIISGITEDAKSRVQIFFDVTQKNMMFLEHYGYTDIEVRLANQYVVKNIVEVIYKNLSLDRVVIIHFEPNDVRMETCNYLSIKIFDGIKTMFRHIDFSLYIKKHVASIDTGVFTDIDKNNQPSFEGNLRAALTGYAYFLQEIGIPLLDGSEWEDGVFFDISSAQNMLYDVQNRELYDDEEEKDKPDS